MTSTAIEEMAREQAKKDLKIIELKLTVLVLVLFLAGIILAACNKQMIDTTYKFDRAIIELRNGTIVEGKVQSWTDFEWTDFEDSDQIQVKIDGVTYLVHSSNIDLIAD